MERKLELKDIAGYLPYGLQMKLSNKVVWFPNLNERAKAKGCDATLTIDLLADIKSGTYKGMADFIPVLRPLSDRYRPITHNGKEIVPIVELAKIAYPYINCWIYDGYKKATAPICYEFWYEKEFNYFCASIPYTNGIESPRNQYRLFDYLHELKIDYRGLIDVGLAIDCNTLDINPYK